MTYSENENKYNSNIYSDDFDTNDEVINDLKELSNKNDIKALRQYIIINKRKLKDYKTKLLNDVVNVKGYKFMRRDGKLIITKISPSSKYCKLEDKESKSEYWPMNTYIDRIASYADFECFSEATPALGRSWNDNIQASIRNENIQPKPAINNFQPKQTSDSSLNDPINADSMVSANNDKIAPINTVLLTQDYKPSDKSDDSKLLYNTANEAKKTAYISTNCTKNANIRNVGIPAWRINKYIK